MLRLRPLVLLVLLAVAVCTAEGGVSTERAPLSTAPSTAPASTAATAPAPPVGPTTTTKPPLAPTTLPPTTACTGIEAFAQPDERRPDYFVAIDADPSTGVVTGAQQVTFRPDLVVDRLVFRLWANGPRPAGAGTSIDVTEPTYLDGTTLFFDRPDPTTFEIFLPEPVTPGQEITVQFRWTLTVGGPSNDRFSRGSESLRLGSFLPLLAWQPGVGWAEEPPTSGFAEATTSPTADWSYTVSVPNGWRVLASGVQDINGRWVAEAVRDIAVSIGRFTIAEGVANAGRPIPVTVGVHDQIDDPNRYLTKVIASIEQFSRDYGPYPWPSYSLAITPELSGGIEFPMHVMQGPGTEGRTTSHEVAHMWFYGLVGNNQGLHPWLDEGLATYAEGRFEGTLDSMATREIPAAGIHQAGQPMTFWESRSSAYYRSVYVQTAAALARLGPVEQVDCVLASYVARNAHRIAGPANLYVELERVFPAWRDALAPAGLTPPE